jgi:hypothetical protein
LNPSAHIRFRPQLRPACLPVLAASFLVAFFLYYSLGAERYIFNLTIGSDSPTHYAMARASEADFLDGQFRSYNLSRAFLPRMAHYTEPVFAQLGLVPAGGDTEPMILTFIYLNTLALALLCWLLLRLAAHYQLPTYKQLWLLILFGLNFSLLKMYAFNPLVTDLWAALLSTAFLYAYLLRWHLAWQVVLFVGLSFSHPLAYLVLAPCLLFPAYSPLRADENQSIRRWAALAYSSLRAGFLFVLVLFWGYYFYAILHPPKHLPFSHLFIQLPDLYLLVPSTLLYLLYLRYVDRTFRPALLSAISRYPFGRGVLYRALLLAALLGFRYALLHYIARPEPGVIASRGGDLWFLVSFFYYLPFIKPGISLVAHFAYFGFFASGIVLYRGVLFRQLAEHGLALPLMGLCFCLFLLDSESRHLSFYYPALVLLLVRGITIRPNRIWAFTLALFLFNLLVSGMLFQLQDWPKYSEQGLWYAHLWANYEGPYMHAWFYYVGASAVLISLLALAYLKKNWSPSQQRPDLNP